MVAELGRKSKGQRVSSLVNTISQCLTKKLHMLPNKSQCLTVLHSEARLSRLQKDSKRNLLRVVVTLE